MKNLFKNKKGIEFTASTIGRLLLMLIVVFIVIMGFPSILEAPETLDAAQIHYKQNCDIFKKDCEKVIINCNDKNVECESQEELIFKEYQLVKDCDYFENCKEEEKVLWEEFKENKLLILNKENDEIYSKDLFIQLDESQIDSERSQISKDDSIPKNKREIAQRAFDEYKNWNSGNLDENDKEAYPLLEKYWAKTTLKNWDPSIAWSAAFISYVVGDFNSPSHSTYINNIYNKKLDGWEFYEIDSKQLEIGDIVCKTRENSAFNPNTGYKSHCDIVVKIENDKVSLIGGNLGDTVSLVTINIDSNHKIASTDSTYIGILS